MSYSATAVAANMCPHCRAAVGRPHNAGCPDFGGDVGRPMAPRQLASTLPVTHKKTSNPYLYLGIVLNITNEARGQTLALYASECKNDVPLFVRELHEFWERFAPAVRPPLTSPESHKAHLVSELVIERKTGRTLTYKGEVLDCTNARDDVLMVILADTNVPGAPWLVCDKAEFASRFQQVATEPKE